MHLLLSLPLDCSSPGVLKAFFGTKVLNAPRCFKRVSFKFLKFALFHFTRDWVVGVGDILILNLYSIYCSLVTMEYVQN